MLGMFVELLRDKCACVLCIVCVAVSGGCNVLCVNVCCQTEMGIVFSIFG